MAVASTAQPGGAESSSTTDGRKGGKPMYTLAQFRAIGDLGAGSFGTVRKMVHEETGEVFAMKVLEKERVVQRDLQEQLKREVLTQLRVKHMNVVRLHYYFEDAARIYCLLEYADGGQLFAYLRRQPGGVPEPRAAQLLGDTAGGLAYLHSLRIVHRDLKPENILLFTQALRAKIGDFGWCVELTQEAPTRRTFCGTLDYLAPEMLNNSPHDTTVDLWALGVLLFEMLMAKAPFTGGSQKETMERICAVRFDVPRGAMSSGPEALVRGLLVLEGSRRTPLSQVLNHPWLAAPSASSRHGTDESVLLDVTRAAPGRGGAATSAAAADAASLDATRIAPRRGATATSAAAADAVSLDATRIAPRRAAAGGAGQEPAGGQGAAEPSLLDRTVTVQRRQAGPGGAAASGGGDAGGAGEAGLLEQTRVVPRRRPREAGGSQPEAPASGRAGDNLDDTDPQMPALQAVPKGFPFASATQAARPGVWDSERAGSKNSDLVGNTEEDAHISLDDLDGRMLGSGGGGASQRGGGREGDFWIIRTEYVASCNPRPKVRSRRGTRMMEV